MNQEWTGIASVGRCPCRNKETCLKIPTVPKEKQQPIIAIQREYGNPRMRNHRIRAKRCLSSHQHLLV